VLHCRREPASAGSSHLVFGAHNSAIGAVTATRPTRLPQTVAMRSSRVDAGITGGIASGQTPDDPGHVTFYVGVADVEAALTKADTLGGRRLFGPAPVPGTEIELGQFTDPEGHIIGLMKSAG
jgi:predicted enzyme related to lactoylglutathione lyase